MERAVFIDESIIRKNNPKGFPLQRALKGVRVGYQYLISGEWTANKPQQKPEGKRLVFDSVEQFRIARDVYFTWEYLESEKITDPALPEVIIDRLLISRCSDQVLYLFVPWGARPEGKPKNEIIVLDKIQGIAAIIRKRHIPTQVLLMPADLYATEINQIDQDLVTRYFSFIRQEAESRGFLVKPWSEIRSENWDTYQEKIARLDKDSIFSILPKGVTQRALEAAKRRSCRTDIVDINNSAYTYLGERIAEAEIIEALYRPIKVSVSSKNKDCYVDRKLPRLYLIPEELQFPWLK